MKYEGKNAVLELLKTDKTDRTKYSSAKTRRTRWPLSRRARAKGVRVQFADEKALDRESETGRHQGVIAYATDFVYADFDELLAPADTPRLVIVCDGIEDVHNLGSILRVAECVGASGVVIPKNKSAQVNESVMRISEGAANHIKIARVPGVNYAVDELKKNGYWVYALEAAGEDILRCRA